MDFKEIEWKHIVLNIRVLTKTDKTIIKRWVHFNIINNKKTENRKQKKEKKYKFYY